MLVGLCGIPMAFLLYFTVKEPARSEAHAEASAEPMGATLKSLLARPPLVHLILGISVASFGSQGISQWAPSFFMRIHGLKLSEVGVLIGLTAGLGAVLGMVVGGLVMTRLSRYDRRWELWMPAIVFALNPFFMAPSFLLPDLRIVLVLQFLGTFIAASGVGVAISSVQTYAEPHRRATAAAIMFLMSALIGLGIGPVAVGVLSDLLAAHFGIESLRYALLFMSLMPFWATTHLWLASRSSARWRLS
jgi:MFS family permease